MEKMRTKDNIDKLSTLYRIMIKGDNNEDFSNIDRAGYALEALNLKKRIDQRLNPNDKYVM